MDADKGPYENYFYLVSEPLENRYVNFELIQD